MKRNESRLQNSLFNFVSGIGYRILTLFTAFLVRTVFVKCLSTDYLGVNGLYSNILSMLSLAELGFGTAMVYSMYQPLADKDEQKLSQLMKLYRKVYMIIGTVILVLGLILVPFLDVLIKDAPNIKGLTFYYILFLLDTVVSYWFFAYRNSLLQADQKAYIVTNYSSIFNLVKTISQIIMLITFHSYSIYLITQIICTIGQNIVIAIKVNSIYPFMKERTHEKLPKNETKKIFKDVKALMLSKISNTVLNSTDNIIISTFVGLKWVGLLSNFMLISDALTAVLCQITNSITASLGNFFVKESKEAGYKLFLRVEFLNFWLYGFSMIALIILLNPFITIWLGKQFTLPNSVIIWIGINFFVAGFINTFHTFRYTLGLFTQAQYRPLIVTALNIVMSIGLSYKWGMAGILAATTLSRMCVNLWYDPFLIHRKGFSVPVKPYYIGYSLRIILLGGIVLGLQYVSEFVLNNGVHIINFIELMLIVAIVPNCIFFFLFHRKEEFKYYYHMIYQLILKVRKVKCNH